jgi:hypothetical protein
MARSNEFPSFFDPRNKTWIITDVWDATNPFTDRFIPQPDTGKDDRWTTTLGYDRPEDNYPIYRIEENGIDIGWVVFYWIRLSDNNPYLYGYELQDDAPVAVINPTTITAFVVADSIRTDYRCVVTTATSSLPNVLWAITVEDIQGQTYVPEPMPPLWSSLWSNTTPVLTPIVPITQYNIDRVVTFRLWMKKGDVTVNSTLASCTVNFPTPTGGFNPVTFYPAYCVGI